MKYEFHILPRFYSIRTRPYKGIKILDSELALNILLQERSIKSFKRLVERESSNMRENSSLMKYKCKSREYS